MRRLALAAALVLCAAAPAGAHPGHGAESVTIDGDQFRYTPADVTIGVGESVVWFWQGTVARNHSVTADPGQAESFDSDPGGPPTNDTHPAGDSFTHVFTHEGSFTYHCQVHSGMTGVVHVVPLTGTPTPLRLDDVRVFVRGERIKVRYWVSQRVDLALRIAERRHHGWHTVKTLHRSSPRGQNKLKLSAHGLEPGPYRLTLTVYDDANRSAEERERFKL